MATYNNYSISSGKGKLYLKEKAPKEGYVEVTYGVDNKKTYHKYVDTIQGLPTSFETKEVDYEGRKLRFLELTLTDGDVFNKVSVPLKNKTGYTNEVKAIVSSLDSLKKGEKVTFTTKLNSYTNKNGDKKDQLSIYVNYVDILGENGKGLSTGFIPFNEIPRAEREEDEDDGEVTWNWKPVNKFFLNKIKEISERINSKPDESSTQSAPAETPVNKPDLEEGEEDDLPF